MNIPGLLMKMKLLNPNAVSEMLVDALGFDVTPEAVQRVLDFAKRVGPFLSMSDRKVDDLSPADIQDVIFGVFNAKVDEQAAGSILTTARRMVTSPDETVKDMISSGKLFQLISAGPSAGEAKTTVIYCPDCSCPIIL